MKLPDHIENAFSHLCCKVGLANAWGGSVIVEASALRLILNFIKEELSTWPELPSKELCAMEALAYSMQGMEGVRFLHQVVEFGGIADDGLGLLCQGRRPWSCCKQRKIPRSGRRM